VTPLSLSKTTSQVVSVQWQTSDGTAKAGTNYVASGGTAFIMPGQTSTTISVPIIDNVHSNCTGKTFNVALIGATGATTYGNTNAVVTMHDTDIIIAPPASVNSSDNNVNASETVPLFNDNSFWTMITKIVPNNTDNYDLGGAVFYATKPLYYNGVGNWWIVILIIVCGGIILLGQMGSPFLLIMALLAGGDVVIWSILPADWKTTIAVIIILDIALVALAFIRPGRER
jgi:hypothetical protein